MSQSGRSRALMLRAVLKAVPAAAAPSAAATVAFRAPFPTRMQSHPALEASQNVRAMSILASGFEHPKIFRGLERKEQRGMAKKGKKGGKGGDDAEEDSGGKKKKGGKKGGKGKEEDEDDEIIDVEAEVSTIMQELDQVLFFTCAARCPALTERFICSGDGGSSRAA
eukprot:2573733-Rhodomonas_salina.1